MLIVNIVSCSNNETFLQINTIYYLKTVAKYRDVCNNNYSFWNALCIASMRLMFRGFSSVCLSSGVWPSYCGRLIRFSAFRHCSFGIFTSIKIVSVTFFLRAPDNADTMGYPLGVRINRVPLCTLRLPHCYLLPLGYHLLKEMAFHSCV